MRRSVLNNLIVKKDNRLMISSLDVANLMRVKHSRLMDAIKGMDMPWIFMDANYCIVQKDSKAATPEHIKMTYYGYQQLASIMRNGKLSSQDCDVLDCFLEKWEKQDQAEKLIERTEMLYNELYLLFYRQKKRATDFGDILKLNNKYIDPDFILSKANGYEVSLFNEGIQAWGFEFNQDFYDHNISTIKRLIVEPFPGTDDAFNNLGILYDMIPPMVIGLSKVINQPTKLKDAIHLHLDRMF